MIENVDHIIIAVEDLESAEDNYTKIFGIEPDDAAVEHRAAGGLHQRRALHDHDRRPGQLRRAAEPHRRGPRDSHLGR